MTNDKHALSAPNAILKDGVEEHKRFDIHAQSDSLYAMALYKFDWERELAERKARGVAGPEPLPHPDDIDIDLSKGTVTIKGPLTPKEKIRWDKACDRMDEFDRDIELAAEALEDAAEIDRKFCEFELAEFTRFRDHYSKTFGDYRTRTRGKAPDDRRTSSGSLFAEA